MSSRRIAKKRASCSLSRQTERSLSFILLQYLAASPTVSYSELLSAGLTKTKEIAYLVFERQR